jgi:hypothetical protein
MTAKGGAASPAPSAVVAPVDLETHYEDAEARPAQLGPVARLEPPCPPEAVSATVSTAVDSVLSRGG